MSATDNRNIGYRVYDAINRQDFAAIEQLFDPNIIRHATGERGLEKARDALVNAFATGPKHFTVEDLLADGDKVALRVKVDGFPLKPGQAEMTIMEIFRIENGRVAEIWGAGMVIPEMQ